MLCSLMSVVLALRAGYQNRLRDLECSVPEHMKPVLQSAVPSIDVNSRRSCSVIVILD